MYVRCHFAMNELLYIITGYIFDYQYFLMIVHFITSDINFIDDRCNENNNNQFSFLRNNFNKNKNRNSHGAKVTI